MSRCRAKRCAEQVPLRMPFCRHHYFRLPNQLKARLIRFYRPNSLAALGCVLALNEAVERLYREDLGIPLSGVERTQR